MSIHHPLRVGSDPDRDPPETLIELTVEVIYPRGTPGRQMRSLARTVADRVEKAVRPDLFGDLPVQVRSDASIVARAEPTLYPVRFGDRVYTCRMDIEEEVELRCAESPLRARGVDPAGGEYDVHVDVTLRPAPGSATSTGRRSC